jgi:Protein of unknown function (DUF3800)
MSALGPIRFVELGISRLHGEKKIMAIISGYFDDSSKDDYVMVLAGLIGDANQWEHFENKWADLLSRHKVPYLHMKEMMSPKGPFAKWLPHEEHRDEVRSFFVDVVAAINSSSLQSYSTIVRLLYLDKFNKKIGLKLKAHPLAVYGCMALIHKAYPGQIISLVFDRIEKIDNSIKTAKKYAAGDSTFRGMLDHIIPIPLPKICTAKDVRPIQAADFLAWETRKHHLKQTEWWEQEGRPDSWAQRFEHYKLWSREKFGSNLPPPRKTLEAVAAQGQMQGSVFDYSGLIKVHQARGGAW